VPEGLGRKELTRLSVELEEAMFLAADELRFEEAARLRDEIKGIQRELQAL
jgi:excinuclease UvrABC nuclease subunit